MQFAGFHPSQQFISIQHVAAHWSALHSIASFHSSHVCPLQFDMLCLHEEEGDYERFHVALQHDKQDGCRACNHVPSPP